MSRIALVVLLALGPLTACNGTGTADPAQAAAPTEYGTRGTVRNIEAGRVTIQHEDVPGYMPAMTMPFDVGQGVSLDGISTGNRVEFRFRPEAGGRHVITSIRKL